jgi:hypothetical protein
MNDVQQYIEDGRVDLATSLVIAEDVEYSSLEEMVQVEEAPVKEDTVTFALVLSVKAPKQGAKKLNYHRGGKEVETYHRLALCR